MKELTVLMRLTDMYLRIDAAELRGRIDRGTALHVKRVLWLETMYAYHGSSHRRNGA